MVFNCAIRHYQKIVQLHNQTNRQKTNIVQEESDKKLSFIDRFERLRDRKGLNVTETCELIGISRSHFYALKDGTQQPTNKMLQRLSLAETGAHPQQTGTPNHPPAFQYPQHDPGPTPLIQEDGEPLTDSQLAVLIAEIRVRLNILEQALAQRSRRRDFKEH